MSELNIESKIVKITSSDESIFKFLSDFRNFNKVIPPDVKDWKSEENTCSFSVKGQHIGLKFANKEPYSTLKISSSEETSYAFFFWIQLKNITANETALKMTIKADLNLMIKAAIKKPGKQFLDQLADQLKLIPYSNF